MNPYRFEALGKGYALCVSKEHTFGTDALLLADFSKARHKDRVCDFGTGCGIIAMLLARDYAPQTIYAVDIQPQAIEQLHQGLKHSSADHPIIPLLGDLRTIDAISKESLDVITCNPPYKAAGSGILSDSAADKLARHETAFSLTELCQTAASLLKFGGRLCICQRPERLCDVLCAMRQAKLEPKRLRLIAKQADSAPWLFLVEAKKGAKPFLQVEPTFYLYETDGSFSEGYRRICHYGED